jgi:thiol:disulfide interchange protein/DsbC/DsbD-like thiol-disulfide interchange protein
VANLTKSISGVAFAAALVATASSIAWAQTSPQDGHHVTASLVVETRSLVPGQPLQLALRQQIPPGWHTYWSNPGDSGLPTTIDWTLPRGFKAGPIVWPTPERVAYGPVVDYGYEHEVLLPVTIETPANLQPGNDIALAAHASWLACSDNCIPEDADLSITIPVSTVTEPDPRWAGAFASTRARIPVPNPFPAKFLVTDDKLTLHVATGDASQLRDVMFFPSDKQVIDDDAPQVITANSEGLVLTLVRDSFKPPPAMLNGVLVFRDLAARAGGSPEALIISAPLAAATFSAQTGVGLVGALLLAFVGGLVLNLMPCVLPVLVIKAFGLMQHARSAPREVRLQGLAYAAGVLISFALIASALIGLRAAGAEIGWGFQLQSPLFVAVMIYVLFAVGLNLSGVFAFGVQMSGAGRELASHGGYAGSFISGALATLVATPCTAPFMAAALGYAITQPWYASLAVFEAVGLGLSFPYLTISFSPGARRFLPKPGAWMLRLKQVLAFPVYGTAVWLMFVLSVETGAIGVTAALAGVVLIGFAAWLYEAIRWSEGRWRGWGIGLAMASVVGAFALLFATGGGGPSRAAETAEQAGLGWQTFSQAKIEELRTQGKPIFIDVTAAWCITCKLNERVALADPAVRRAFSDGDVAAIRADWTRQDAGITRMLEANGRAGVPLYLFYPKPRTTGERRSAIILPQILTTDIMLRTIRAE